MITIDVRINRFPGIGAELKGSVAALVAKTAFDIEATAKNSMTHSSPPPSAPGEPPGVDTGALKSSIHAQQESDLVWNVVAGVHYGPYLEFGTRRMAARPFMVPATQKVGKSLKRAVRLLG